jgi:HD-GYP domain-containing protein (c-di-GMP phosphodiesterase class II)/DNA-binding CsgD family transcriptional regulator
MSPAACTGTQAGPRSKPSGTAELLCALSFGSGLAFASRMEHGTNTAFVATKLARSLGLAAEGLEAVFYGALLKDVGCGACAPLLAPFFPKAEPALGISLMVVDSRSPSSLLTWAKGQMRLDSTLPVRLARLAAFAARCGVVAHEAASAHCEVAADFASGLGFGPHVQDAVRFQYERYDGRSRAFGRGEDQIPRSAQVLHLAQAVDAVRGLVGVEEAASMVRERTGSYFAPDVAQAYLDLASGLWPPGDDDPVPLADVLSCDPGTSVDELPGDRRLAVCEALADFADLKSARPYPHSHTVASLAAMVAAELGLDEPERDRLRLAGLVHDLGRIAVPVRLLEEAGDETAAHRDEARLAEPLRLHPYYAQRILSRVPALAGLAADAGAHHERLDGSGYPAGLRGGAVPLGARVLAAADTWAERSASGPPALTDDDALDPDCVRALRSHGGAGPARQRRRFPSGPGSPATPALSAREIEVLRLVAQGASNPDISKALSISRRTAEHHVEHILAKLGVTSRTAAVAYTLTHGLLS